MTGKTFKIVAQSCVELRPDEETRLLHGILGWLSGDYQDTTRTAADLRDYIDEEVTRIREARKKRGEE